MPSPTPGGGQPRGRAHPTACGHGGSCPAATGHAGQISENGTAQRLSLCAVCLSPASRVSRFSRAPRTSCISRVSHLPAVPGFPFFSPPRVARFPPFPPGELAGTAVPAPRQRGRPSPAAGNRAGEHTRRLAGTAVPVRRQQGMPDKYLKTARRRGFPSAPFACLRLPALPAFPALPVLPAFPAAFSGALPRPTGMRYTPMKTFCAARAIFSASALTPTISSCT